MPASSKYKLFSASNATTEGGGKPPCAFFASEKGCRNGENCKFAHVKPHEKVGVLDSVVSSESSDTEEEEDSQKKKRGESPSPFVKNERELDEAKKAQQKKKKKKQDDPFANPKQKKQKTTPTPPNNSTTKNSTPKTKTATTTEASSKSSAPPKAKSGVDFRSLDLPIASFSIPANDDKKKKKNNKKQDEVSEPGEIKTGDGSASPTSDKPALPLPKSTEAGRKWLRVVQKTREHPRYASNYDFAKYKALDEQAGYASNTWVTTKPTLLPDNPQCIAIDCEMCETQDPVSGNKDPRALCRISVLDVETDEVLLDTLVKPSWPVTDYRTWVNGISPEHLQNVQFTLRHAQAFMMALCSQETVILGHAVHNDLAALRILHHCVADSSLLYRAEDSETATVALRDLAVSVMKKEMPEKHDSVNDARVAFQCLEHYRKNNGKVETVTRTPKPNNNRPDYASQLFVHRIPKNTCDKSQLAKMFLAHTDVQPTQVDDIVFTGNAGKTHVHFQSGRHGNLAFDTLEGKAEADLSGRLQKKVYFRSGDYCRVRKMAYERNSNANGNRSSGTSDELNRRQSS